MPKNTKSLIVVLGMHRSGTSAITRGLLTLNIDLGTSFIPTGKVNPKGFWEDEDIYNLNKEILINLNSDWHHLTTISESDVKYLKSTNYLQRAIDLLNQKTTHKNTFAFKDPRVSKLLPFWKEVFSIGHFDVKYVFAIRHPKSVAQSLTKRNGFIPEKGYLLWLSYIVASLSASSGENRVFIDFDQLLHSPEHELKRIADKFDLVINSTALESYKNSFLEPNLRHTLFTMDDLEEVSHCPMLAKDIYLKLHHLATGGGENGEKDISRHIKKWEMELSRLAPAFTLIDRLEIEKKVPRRDAAKANNDTVSTRYCLKRVLNYPRVKLGQLYRQYIVRTF